jgi:hypothetical protein
MSFKKKYENMQLISHHIEKDDWIALREYAIKNKTFVITLINEAIKDFREKNKF